MMNALADIVARKKEHVAARKAEFPESRALEKARLMPPPRGFRHALLQKIKSGKLALIAEIKKASPSKGLIRGDFHPIALARAYADGGAACLSVLTDEPYFQGHDEYLKAVHKAVSLPLLRKDFMLEPYQIVESRMLGADCVLLIMGILSDAQAQELAAAATSLGMDVLVEVHDKTETDRALNHLKPMMVGINNRNLKTLEVNLATAETLVKHLPKNILAVCESGIAAPADIARMRKAGLSCFLVGESLMRQNDVMRATQRLLNIIPSPS